MYQGPTYVTATHNNQSRKRDQRFNQKFGIGFLQKLRCFFGQGSLHGWRFCCRVFGKPFYMDFRLRLGFDPCQKDTSPALHDGFGRLSKDLSMLCTAGVNQNPHDATADR